jgi:glutaredoxin-related protein
MGILELQVCRVLQDSEGHQVRRDDMVNLEILDHPDLQALLEKHWGTMPQHWQPC